MADAILLIPTVNKGRRIKGAKTMTFNSNLQQLAISAIGALFAASLFITAAVGPAGQFI